MLLKFTEGKVLGLLKDTDLIKTANQIVTKVNPDYIYIRVRAVTGKKPNKNGDFFSPAELEKHFDTFIGKGVYLNHNSKEVENSIGKIVDAEYIKSELAIDCLLAIDKKRASKQLVRGIENGDIKDVSMGAKVGYSLCSICGHKAYEEEDFCDHIQKYKGRKIITPKGIKEVYEDNRDVEFFEISYVTTGADEDAKTIEKVAKVKVGRAITPDEAELIIEEFFQSEFKTDDANKAERAIIAFLQQEYPSLSTLENLEVLLKLYKDLSVVYADKEVKRKMLKTHGRTRNVIAEIKKRKGEEVELEELVDEIAQDVDDFEEEVEETPEEAPVPTNEFAAKLQELEAEVAALEAEGMDVKALREKIIKLKKARVEKSIKEIEKSIKEMKDLTPEKKSEVEKQCKEVKASFEMDIGKALITLDEIKEDLTKEEENKTGSVFDTVGGKLYLPKGFYAIEEAGKAVVKDSSGKTVSTLEINKLPEDPAGAINYLTKNVRELKAGDTIGQEETEEEKAKKEKEEKEKKEKEEEEEKEKKEKEEKEKKEEGTKGQEEEIPVAPEITDELIQQVIDILIERGYTVTPPAGEEESPINELPGIEELEVSIVGEGKDKILKYPVDGKLLVLKAIEVFPEEEKMWDYFGSEEYQKQLKKELEISGIEKVMEMTSGTLEEVETKEKEAKVDISGYVDKVKELTTENENLKLDNDTLRETIRLHRALETAEAMAGAGLITVDKIREKAEELSKIKDEDAFEKVLATLTDVESVKKFNQKGLKKELRVTPQGKKDTLKGIKWSHRGLDKKDDE